MKLITILALATTAFAVADPAVPEPAGEKQPAAAEEKPDPPAKATPHKGWTADLEAALKQAKTDNKMVLLEFTGSDWCPPCKFMRENVFSKEDFVKKASEKFILVEIDMPRGDQATAKKNEPTVKKYKVNGFPTIVLLDADGKEFSRFVAAEHRDTKSFLKRLDAEIEKKDLD